jgi:hypothetical protein
MIFGDSGYSAKGLFPKAGKKGEDFSPANV